MWFVYAILSSLVFGLAGVFMKISQMKKGSVDHLLFGLYITGTLGFAVNGYFEGSLIWDDWRVYVAGILIAIGSAWGNIAFMQALDYGPASLTAPMMNTNIVLIVLMSVLLYGETIGFGETAGVVLLLSAVFLISYKKEPLTITEKKWFWLVSLASLLFFVRNGGLKVTQELGLVNTPILLFSYFISILWFGWALLKSKSSVSITPQSARTGVIWGLITGVFSYGGLQLYSLALEDGRANIVAPIFSTYGLVIVFGSVLLFKEKLTGLQKIALVLLFAGLVLVKV